MIDPLLPTLLRALLVEASILDVPRHLGPCWHARVWWEGKERQLHNVVRLALGLPLTAGHVRDHLCRQRDCANPAHNEEVTVQVNTLRGEAVLFR